MDIIVLNKMAESNTPSLSIYLYRYMCEHIVGNKDYVERIRLMNTIRDNLSNGGNDTIITSGSFGEGLEMIGSDLDTMHVLKEYDVFEEANIQMNRNTAQFLMETENTQPGFVQLRFLHSNDKCILELCENINSHKYFSNVLFKENFIDEFFSSVHGPCLSDEKGRFDLAYCLHSKSWVKPAQPWLTRSNKSWPGSYVRNSVVKHGVLFVPIGIKGSTTENIEWRLSFSVGEKFLIYTFTHAQFLCYALMKMLLKDKIDIELDCKDLLCSYFMKTILFWLSEELPTSIWRPENLISCFMRYFRRLIYCVEYSVCPHYFISEYNLFEDKIKGHAREVLLNKLHIIYSRGWKFIAFPFHIPNTDLAFYFQLLQQKKSYAHSFSTGKLLASAVQRIAFHFNASEKLWENGIHMILSRNSSKIKNLYLYYMSRMLSDTMQNKDIYDNKSVYKQYKTRVSTLLQSLYHDSVSGWLKLASFFYKTKQFNVALEIVRYSLFKCSPEKLYPQMKMSYFHHDFLDTQIYKKMNFVHLWKTLLVDFVTLYPNCMLTPDELDIDVLKSKFRIPSVVYAHFLCFLCHYHLNNRRKCQISIRNLQTTIEENFLISKGIMDGVSYNILGITFQLMEDKESAKQAFVQSVRYYSSVEVNTTYLSLKNHNINHAFSQSPT